TERRHPDGLDVDAELARPELRNQQMRPAVRLITHHVVGRDLGAQHGVVPVLHGQKLVVVEHMGGTGDVAGHEDATGDYAVDVERPATSVAAHPPEPGGQPGPV